MILNPNCSELVCRLPTESMEEAKEMLEKIGIDVERFSMYSFSDEESNHLVDYDNPNLPDFQNHAYMVLQKGHDGDEESIHIVGHQHCQVQLYETVKKIQAADLGEFYGYDGGGGFEEEYNEWFYGNVKNDDYQKGMREIILGLINNEQVKDEINYLLNDLPLYTNLALNKSETKRKIIDELNRIVEKNIPEDASDYIIEYIANAMYIMMGHKKIQKKFLGAVIWNHDK